MGCKELPISFSAFGRSDQPCHPDFQNEAGKELELRGYWSGYTVQNLDPLVNSGVRRQMKFWFHWCLLPQNQEWLCHATPFYVAEIWTPCILNPLIKPSRLVINGCQANVQWQKGIVLLSQESLKSTWLCSLASVFFYILQNISHLREHKAKYRWSSQIAEVSLSLNFMRESPESSESDSEIWNECCVSKWVSLWLYELVYVLWIKESSRQIHCSSGFELRTFNWVYKRTPYWTVRQPSVSP